MKIHRDVEMGLRDAGALRRNLEAGRFATTDTAKLKTEETNAEPRAVIEASKAAGKPSGGWFWADIRDPNQSI